MDNVYKFSDYFKSKRTFGRGSLEELLAVKEANVHYYSNTKVYSKSHPLGYDCEVMVFQPVDEKFGVQDRVLLAFTDVVYFELGEKLITKFLFDKADRTGERSTLREGFSINTSEFIRIMQEGVRELGKKGLLHYCGLEIMHPDEGEDVGEGFVF